MMKKMKDDKADFLKQFARVQDVSKEEFANALKREDFKGKIPSVISVPRAKREAADDIEALEQRAPPKHKNKKQKRF